MNICGRLRERRVCICGRSVSEHACARVCVCAPALAHVCEAKRMLESILELLQCSCPTMVDCPYNRFSPFIYWFGDDFFSFSKRAKSSSFVPERFEHLK